MTPTEKGHRFQALHTRETAFVIPNPWDAGTARVMAGLGYEALATTSAGFAFARGRMDGNVRREDVLGHIGELASATDLPVSADLENGFGDAPETAAETIRLAAEAGAVGGSIEDYTGRREAPIYDFDHAVERVSAAAEAARAAPHPFTFTARAENLLYGHADLDDTIRRLQAYAEAGADVLYAPRLVDLDDIRSVCAALDKPVNLLMGLAGMTLTVAEAGEAGVKRISVGSGLARAAYGTLLRALEEMKDPGSFGWADGAASFADLAPYMSGKA